MKALDVEVIILEGRGHQHLASVFLRVSMVLSGGP